ncbi:MAG: large subunit ribosomal protein [Blastocatellia bacterium]|jgi:large subunit ribosomal protein L22|nr:large subunit ribosomal protein [Blastocatellia bacterium]
MEAKASAKYLHGSAQKARLVVDMIRGKNVNQALAILQFTNKRAAGHIEKCVRSAIANASEAAEKANIAIDPDELWVKAAFVDRGPTKNRRRMRPAPQGRAYREKRHFCHVTVLLSSDEKLETTKGNGKAEAGRATAPAESKSRRRGGAAAAPRAKRAVTTDTAAAAPQAETATAEPAVAETTTATTTAPVETGSAETTTPTVTNESTETTE